MRLDVSAEALLALAGSADRAGATGRQGAGGGGGRARCAGARRDAPVYAAPPPAAADFAGAALVMTSGNVSDEPIAYRDDDALERLERDRRRVPGARPSDPDPNGRLGRARVRGRAADAAPLPRLCAGAAHAPDPRRRPLLACGAEQKATFCVARGDRAWVGHHIGDLEHVATLTAYREGIGHFERMFAVAPELVAHDLHPDYLSTQYALELDDVELLGVQHHHAHLAACLAEHGVTAPAVGAIFDGTGLGADGTVWGGELLVGDLRGYERAGWLWPVRMPGGAAAVRQPWRMAAAWLRAAFGSEPPLPGALVGVVSPRDWEAIGRIGRAAELAPLTSSIGRLFDAVGVLCGAPAQVSYEGQAAVELEALAWTPGMPAPGGGYRWDCDGSLLDPRAGGLRAGV